MKYLYQYRHQLFALVALVALGAIFGWEGTMLALPIIGMATTRVSDIDDEVGNVYNRTLLMRAVPLMVYASFGQRANIAANAGTRTIRFRRYGSLSAATTALTEGTTPAGSTLSKTDVNATPLQYGDFTEITDRVSTETLDPVLTEATEIFGDQMGDTNDQLARAVVVAGTNVQYASSAVSRVTVATGMTLGLTEVKKAVRTLKLANARRLTGLGSVNAGAGTVPVGASFVGVVSPNTGFDLKGVTGFSKVESYAANTALLPGEIGKLDEVRFVETTNGKVFSGAGAGAIDVHATMVFASDAFGIVDLGNSQATSVIFKALGSSGSADPLNQRQTLGWKEYFIAKILNDNFMVRIEHAVTA